MVTLNIARSECLCVCMHTHIHLQVMEVDSCYSICSGTCCYQRSTLIFVRVAEYGFEFMYLTLGFDNIWLIENKAANPTSNVPLHTRLSVPREKML